MKNQRAAITLALVVGVATFVGVKLHVNSIRAEGRGASDVKVLTAASPIEAGAEITQAQLSETPISVSKELFDAMGKEFYRADEASKQPFVGTAKQKIPAGAPILKSWLAVGKVTEPLRDRVALETDRAWSLEVTRASFHGGLLKPQDIVDVIATMAVDGEVMSRTILQAKKVIALNGKLIEDGEDKGSGSTVTLTLTPQECEAVEVLRQTGAQFALSLRGSKGSDVVNEQLSRNVTLFDRLTKFEPEKVNKDPFIKESLQ